MSIIIRPSPGVFHRTMPLVVIFGAYRRFETDTPLDSWDHETITGGVALARRLHMPLAFTREVGAERSAAAAGVWLPDCRPKITDRVFDHPQGSCFQNRDFMSVFTTITDREIYFIGPRGDSSMRASVDDAEAFDRDVKMVIPSHPLQKCSMHGRRRSPVFRATPYSERNKSISLREWESLVCSVEYKYAK